MVYLRIRVEINVSEDQEKDARKVVFGCFQMCFGHASMRSPIKSRAGRKTRGEHSFLNGCSFFSWSWYHCDVDEDRSTA